MKQTIARLLGLLIVVAMVLSGCNLIEVDPVMQLDEDLEALKKDYATVLGTYDGGEITKEDVIAMFLYQYSYYSYMYSMMGASLDETTVESMKQNALESYAQIVAIDKQFDNLGLSFTDEELKTIDEQAEENYQSTYDYYYELAEGDTEELKAKQTEYNLFSEGYTREIIYEDTMSQAKYAKVEESVFAEITEVSEEDLQVAYEEKVDSDEDTYDGNYSSFESAMATEGSAVCWMPEGYRTVKHILLIPEEDVLQAVVDARSAYDDAQDALDDLNSEMDALKDDDEEDMAENAEEQRTAEEIQKDIDEAEAKLPELKKTVEKAEADCLASVQDKLEEIYGRIEAGEDFDALMAEYGEDPGMQSEPAMSRGYYVCKDSTSWDENFTAGSMLLENVGDVSETPVISTSGIHIIRYESDVTPGAVALEDVREELTESTLEEMRYEAFNEQILEWVEAINPQYNVAAFTF